MKKLKIKKIMKGVCFVLIFCALFFPLQTLFQAKWITDDGEETSNTSSWVEYRSLARDTVDVLFVGTSHAYSGMDPMRIYGQTGITSYVFGGPGMRMDLSYLVLKSALKTQSPAAVFLEMSGIQFEEQQDEGKVHVVSDMLGLSPAKTEFAFNNGNPELKPLDVLFPFFRFHTRWSRLNREDFQYAMGELEPTCYRGHFLSYRTKPTRFRFYRQKNFTLTDRNLDYVSRIKKLCDEKGIDLVMYKVPSPSWRESQSKGCEELAERLDVPYLELFYAVEEMGVDAATDFRDSVDHLNQYGAEKVSDYIGRYIQERYGLEDQRPYNRRWNDDLIQYEAALQASEAKENAGASE